jgi:hypothetical protein
MVLSGCVQQPFFVTDGGCGTVLPENSTPSVYIASGDVPRVYTDIAWSLDELPTDLAPTSVYSGAITTAPFAEFLDATYAREAGFESSPLVAGEELFFAVDNYAQLSSIPGTADVSITHEVVTPEYINLIVEAINIHIGINTKKVS